MNFHEKLSAFFLNRQRLTILSFLLLIFLGLGSGFFLKTTGFPNPDIKFFLVHTFYLGASSETVLEDVTIPVEAVLKDIEGVDSISSTSSNSVSFVGVTVDEDYETDAVVNKMSAQLAALSLPDGAERPEVSVPSIAGPDMMFSLVGEDTEQVYETYQVLKEELLEMPGTGSVTELIPLKKRLKITLDEEQLATLGADATIVITALSTFGESLPVVSGVTLDGESQSLLTALDEDSLQDVKKLKIGGEELMDLAVFSWDYSFEGDADSRMAFNIGGDPYIFQALHFQVSSRKGTDLNQYTEELEELFEDHEELMLVKDFNFDNGFDDLLLVESYSIQNDNEQQVEEVVGGLIGTELSDEWWGKAGFLLGGMQLVFLLMLLFVSWRTAVVAALAIPVSILFSTIYIYAIGEDLNTLVLFSLVLAIGLVVDPALVLLESVQRKVDMGLKANEAAMAAVKDVGMGLFLAALTSAIVFVPFGVVSGILGQIIVYIPITIIPAVVGSYVVPLVFLTWLGSHFLKREKNKTHNEEENLWGIAKLLIRVNTRLLRGPLILKALIILLGLAVPLGVTGYLFQTGAVKSVQFASSENYPLLQLSFVNYPKTSSGKRSELEEEILEAVSSHEAVAAVFPFQNGVYLVQLKEEREATSVEVVEEIEAEFEERELSEEFFDLVISTISNGPPGANYHIALAMKSSDPGLFKENAEIVAEMLGRLCKVDNAIMAAKNCEGEEMVSKINDGFTDQENTVIEVILDRGELEAKQLGMPGMPLTALVNLQLRNLFSVNGGEPVATLHLNGESVEVILESGREAPETLAEIKNTVIVSLAGEVLRLKDIATIREVDTQAAYTRLDGQTYALVQARLQAAFSDPGTAAMATQAVLEALEKEDLSVEVEQYGAGDIAGFLKSFQELFTALVLAIVITYLVLVLFFGSFSLPLVILYAIPLTFIGVFPALALFANGQFGFLEIIGLIILVGLVENVAIFLIDAAKQCMREGYDAVDSIAYASGLRFRAVILTKLVALASLAPLAVLSEQYRSLALVIIFGLLASGVTSLITTPILFVFFSWLSARFHALPLWAKPFFFPLALAFIIGFWIYDRF